MPLFKLQMHANVMKNVLMTKSKHTKIKHNILILNE